MITFKYQKEKSDLGVIYRPVANVLLEIEDFKLEIPMYIDSGADITIIPLKLGEALGFRQDSAQIREIRGIAGAGVPYMLKAVKLTIGNIKFPARIAWSLIEAVPPLLGRLDVFEQFKIIFDEEKKTIEFHPK